MFELKTKQITRWGISIHGEDIYFNTKQKAIEYGRESYRSFPDIRLFEEYRLFDISHAKSVLIDEQRFDRTILIRFPSDSH